MTVSDTPTPQPATRERYVVLDDGPGAGFSVWERCDKGTCLLFHRAVATCKTEYDANRIAAAIVAESDQEAGA
jgi:hypothetical protein